MSEIPSTSFFKKYGLHLVGLGFWGLYLLGTFFPDFWWTTHWLAFLPAVWKYGLLLIALGFTVYPFFNKGESPLPNTVQQFSDSYGMGVIVCVTLLVGVLIYLFPMTHDYYGDSFKLVDKLDQTIPAIPNGTNDAFFKFGLSPWDGHISILAIVTYIAFYTGLSYGQAFLWLDLICGCLFVFTWLSLLRFYLQKIEWRFIMGLAGITAPFMLIYLGHAESYAPVFLFFLSWLALALVYLKSKNNVLLWSLIPLLLFCIKLHPIALLFAPTLGFLFLEKYAGSTKWAQYFMSWKGILRGILIPVFAVGAILYFFVFEDYNDPRRLNFNVQEFDRLFLPLVSPDPPLDTYNLLGFNHIFDYFSEVLLWSPISIFLLIFILIYHRKNINWNHIGIRLIGLPLIFFASLLFVINPLLSMQMDWDLLAIPAPILLVFTLLLVKQIEKENLSEKVLSPVLGIALLCLPAFAIHSNTDALSQRYESLGIRMYHSYYEWSDKVLKFALNLPAYPSRKAYEERSEKLLLKLKPHALPNVDFSYAGLLIEEGKYHLRVAKDYTQALAFLKRAEGYYPKDKNLTLYFMETHFMRKEFKDAFDYSQELIRQQYPTEQKAIAISVQCAIEAGLSKDALSLSSYYVKTWNDNPIFQTVKQKLESGVPTDSLRLLFAQP